jgi:endonuclease/exonuclease/phosphatase family metal-dependent hydrolase
MAPVSLRGQAPPQLMNASNGCRELVDERGRRLNGGPAVAWSFTVDTRQRERLDRQCRTVGPIVVRPEPADPAPAASHASLVVVSWNVHVGGGNLEALLDQLTTGKLGVAVSDYVLLLEEAHRGSGLVPASVDAGTRVPRRIAPQPNDRARRDIVTIARRHGLALYYVPSMRNGRGAPYEDRGNAILSTLPLSDLTAIELPLDRQRRVAISATVRGVDAQSRAWRLRLVTVHLDALVGASRLWIFATGWRGRQARTVTEAFDWHSPAVVGADLNTWLAGRSESAYTEFARALAPSPAAPAGATTDAHGRLDFMFFQLPLDWVRSSRRITDRFDSDHRPVIATINFH